ncbi:hypothetical protein [Clostridium beijerinckii]|uniref:hypothetical protein n=1 Tax=Clostridium beijerinckii TaxID=1520 RepID=UPI0014941804|nr:hypothetical protein [Clostridium beijerinckii]NOW06121.1 uncharacterized protein YrrD [Clostridium beijerinckii]NYC00736.1 uncharacterized protein YrrD [Clostridium beijerinckii]
MLEAQEEVHQKEFKKKGKNNDLRYTLGGNILRRLSDIYFDITDFSKNFVEEELNDSITKYFYEEFSDI